MAKRIRRDLQGAVWIDGRPHFAGADLPAGTEAGDHVLEHEEPTSSPKPPRKSPAQRTQKKQSDS